jgi:hypothetical protein
VANDITGNPWTLDTPSAGTLVWAGNIRVEHFEFTGYALNTDNVTVKDRAGRVVWSATGMADLSPVISTKVGWTFDGLYLTTLTSGKLRVYIK